MLETTKFLHSIWSYLVLVVLVLATINALYKFFSNKEFHAKDFRLSLFALIVSHIQLLLGVVYFFVSDKLGLIQEVGMGGIMKDSTLRSIVVEHPFTMIIAIALITIGYSKHKKKLTSKPKFKMIAIFYTLALILVLAKIPWSTWF